MFLAKVSWGPHSRVSDGAISAGVAGPPSGRGSFALRWGGRGKFSWWRVLTQASKFQCLLTLVRTKRLLQRKYLYWARFLTHYFRVYEILQLGNFLGFSLINKITHKIQNENMVSDFSLYFHVKSSTYKNKSRWNIQTSAFAKISTGKNIAA